MSGLQGLFTEIESHHSWEPAVDSSEIIDFQTRLGCDLPSDLVEFYGRYKSVRLFVSKYGTLYRFVPIAEIHPTRIDIYGEDAKDWGPDSWLTICDVQDGNYIGVDIDSKTGNRINYIDCFHETFAVPGESRIIALSFEELLDRSLRSNGQLYFLQKDFTDYGDGRPLTVENATIRIANPKAPKKGWQVNFVIRGSHKCYHKFFSDEEFGGEAESLEAVKQYIEESRRNML